jgi:hypothetical protein
MLGNKCSEEEIQKIKNMDENSHISNDNKNNLKIIEVLNNSLNFKLDKNIPNISTIFQMPCKPQYLPILAGDFVFDKSKPNIFDISKQVQFGTQINIIIAVVIYNNYNNNYFYMYEFWSKISQIIKKSKKKLKPISDSNNSQDHQNSKDENKKFDFLTANIDNNDEKEYKEVIKNEGYIDKDIENMTQKELESLILEDGFFSIDEISNRLSTLILDMSSGSQEQFEIAKTSFINTFFSFENIFDTKLPIFAFEILENTLLKIEQHSDFFTQKASVMNIQV